jgi:hypothetical protein
LAEAEPGRGEAGGRVLVDEESIGDGEAAVGREGLNAGPVEDDGRSTEHEQRAERRSSSWAGCDD